MHLPATLKNLIRADRPESPKRAGMVAGIITLCVVDLMLCAAICWQAGHFRAVDTGLIWGMVAVTGSVAALAGVSHRAKESEDNTPCPHGDTPETPAP